MKKLAQIFKALGDETRLKIIEMLIGKELCVFDILEAFDKTQPVISYHLKTLKQVGLVLTQGKANGFIIALHRKHLKSLNIHKQHEAGTIYKRSAKSMFTGSQIK